MKIFLIRHGESMANIGENYVDRILDAKVPLTQNGINQALTAGKWLKKYCDDNSIDTTSAVIWRSPYVRTIQTSDAFNVSLNIQKLKEDVTLVEQRFGLFDCIPDEDIKRIYPIEYEEYQRQKMNGGKFFAKPPMGEAPYDVAIRIAQFFSTIWRDLEKNNVDTLFVFTHGTTLRCFLMRYLHYTLQWYEQESNPHNCWIHYINENVDMGYIYNQ